MDFVAFTTALFLGLCCGVAIAWLTARCQGTSLASESAMEMAALKARLEERSRRAERLEEDLLARTEALETLRSRLAVLRTSRERLTAKLGAEHMLAERFTRLRTDLNAALEAYLEAASSIEGYGMEVAQNLLDLEVTRPRTTEAEAREEPVPSPAPTPAPSAAPPPKAPPPLPSPPSEDSSPAVE